MSPYLAWFDEIPDEELAHAAGGTEQTGTVRVSVSAFNTSREITAFLAAMQALV